MNQTTTSPEFVHTLSLVLNSAVSVAYSQHAVNAEKQDAASPEDSVAARQLDTLKTQFDILCNDLYLIAPTIDLSELFDELDNAITRGDVDAAEKIRNRELSPYRPAMSRVRAVDAKIRDLEAQITILRDKAHVLEEERGKAAVTAVESGITKDQLADATGRDIADVNCWLLGV